MTLVALSCPQCGGTLDPETIKRGLARCGHCDAWSLLAGSRDHLRRIEGVTLPRQTSEQDLRDDMLKRLRKAGVKPAPDLLLDTEVVRYIGRRGRVRVTPYQTEQNHVAKEHEEVREGLFAIPLDEDVDAALLFFEDVDHLEKASVDVPEDLEDRLLAYEDRIDQVVRADREQRLFEKTRPLKYSYRWEASCNFHDEVLLLDVPLAVFRFQYAGTKNTWTEAWSGTRPDGAYEAAFSFEDGRLLRWQVPSKGPNFVVFLVGFILVTTVLPMVIALLVSVVAIVVPLIMVFLGGFLAFLGA